MMPQKLKVMAVVCHPADAIDLAGGTLCLHAQRGDEVTVVVCTHGVDTHHWDRIDKMRRSRGRHKALPSQKTAIGQKEKEVVAGMRILQVSDVRFLRFPDELLTLSTELIEAIATVMADVQPHLLITHNPTESAGFGDVGHADSAIASLKARYLANTPRFLKTGSAPNRRRFPSQIFFAVMNGETTRLSHEGSRHPEILVDITPVVDRKVKAMDCLKTQYYPGDLARKVIEDVNGRLGLHWRMPYAEGFEAHYPQGYSCLPVNEHLMKLSEQSVSEALERMRITTQSVPFEAT